MSKDKCAGRKIIIRLQGNITMAGTCEGMEPYGIHITPEDSTQEQMIPMRRVEKVMFAPEQPKPEVVDYIGIDTGLDIPPMSTHDYLKARGISLDPTIHPNFGDIVPFTVLIHENLYMPLNVFIFDPEARKSLLRWFYQLEKNDEKETPGQ